jgi:hypothetical protein
MVIPPLESKLNSVEGNLKLYNDTIKECEKVDTLTSTIDLYQSDRFYMAVKDLGDQKKRIVYYLRYERDNEPFIGHFVVQEYLWIDKKIKSEINNLPKKIFFELLDDYLTVVADSEQTNDGIRFWRNRINDALQLGLNVYYADFNNNTLKKLSKMSDVVDADLMYGINSTNDLSYHKRLVISKRNLKVNDEY